MCGLRELRADARTLVFYEAPHRLQETLAAMSESLGPRREAPWSRARSPRCSKRCIAGTLAALAEQAQADADMKRGEIVIVVEGAAATSSPTSRTSSACWRNPVVHLPVSQAADSRPASPGANRNRAYKAALALKKPGS